MSNVADPDSTVSNLALKRFAIILIMGNDSNEF